jgi:glutamyl-tRNA synthetase
VAAAQRDLEWLGLDWDGPVEIQSAGLSRFAAAVRKLSELGLAYACTCTRADIRAAASAPQLGSEEPRYPGTCRGRYASIEQAEQVSGRHAGVRFQVPEGYVTFRDELAGEQSIDVQRDVGDFLIARRDAAPAYQLAVVVDDAAQSVDEVVRGDDLLTSTARQLLLQRALGFAPPRWAHVPLVLDADGRRLSKRAGALGLSELRAGGIDPRAIVSWAARTSGMPVEGRARATDLIRCFDSTRVPRAPVVLAERDLELMKRAD